MRLKPVDTELSPEVTVICINCGKHVSSREAFADLDGEAFKAYYCRACANSVKCQNEDLYSLVIAAGIEYSNHESDLYIPVNEQTRALIAKYRFSENVTTFRNNIDGKPWYDIPFAYRPYWEAKSR